MLYCTYASYSYSIAHIYRIHIIFIVSMFYCNSTNEASPITAPLSLSLSLTMYIYSTHEASAITAPLPLSLSISLSLSTHTHTHTHTYTHTLAHTKHHPSLHPSYLLERNCSRTQFFWVFYVNTRDFFILSRLFCFYVVLETFLFWCSTT